MDTISLPRMKRGQYSADGFNLLKFRLTTAPNSLMYLSEIVVRPSMDDKKAYFDPYNTI